MSDRFSLSHVRHGPFLVRTLRFKASDLPEAWRGFRIAQLTDLHFGPATSEVHLREAVRLTNALSPDIIVLTGDYIQYTRTGFCHAIATNLNPTRLGLTHPFTYMGYRRKVRELSKGLAAILEDLSPKAGIFGVFGNHDYAEGIGSIKKNLPSKITWLTNSSTHISRGNTTLIITGVDDFKRGKPELERAISNRIPAASTDAENIFFRLLLSHNPDISLSPENHLLQSFQLILCGHTHGGQFCLPFWGPIVTRTRQKKHVTGVSQLEETTIFTSNGVGYGAIGLRVLCPPEITLIEFE